MGKVFEDAFAAAGKQAQSSFDISSAGTLAVIVGGAAMMIGLAQVPKATPVIKLLDVGTIIGGIAFAVVGTKIFRDAKDMVPAPISQPDQVMRTSSAKRILGTGTVELDPVSKRRIISFTSPMYRSEQGRLVPYSENFFNQLPDGTTFKITLDYTTTEPRGEDVSTSRRTQRMS